MFTQNIWGIDSTISNRLLMQVPFVIEKPADRNSEVAGRVVFAQSAQILSIEAQLRLRELYDYVEFCRGTLGEIARDLALLESDPEDFAALRQACDRLKRFCLEADSWGFTALYQIGTGLQVLLLRFGSGTQDNAFWNTLNRGLGMLSVLIGQCESEFRSRIAVADTLDSFDQIYRD